MALSMTLYSEAFDSGQSVKYVIAERTKKQNFVIS